MARSAKLPDGFKMAPTWLIYCDTDWLSDTARRLKALTREERSLRYKLTNAASKESIVEIKNLTEAIAQYDKQIRQIARETTELLGFDEHPHIQRLRLSNAHMIVRGPDEGEDHFVEIELRTKTEPQEWAIIRITRPA